VVPYSTRSGGLSRTRSLGAALVKGKSLDALLADDGGSRPLLRRHRRDDGLDAHQLLVVEGDALGQFAEQGELLQQIGDAPHLLDQLDLLDEVVEIEVAGEDLLRVLLGLLLVDDPLEVLHQADDVAEAEDPGGEALRPELLQLVHRLAHADELDGLTGDLLDGERGATAGVAVHLGEHYTGERKLFVELFRGANRVLSGHGVGHEQNLRRIQQLLQRLHLIHQLIVDVQAAGRIDDEYVAARDYGLTTRFFHQALDGRGVGLADGTFVDVTLHRLRDYFQLLARRWTIDVH